jgi:catechol 2,3-dioxygenase-like lactoylglutathione lyase family enzyme
VPRGPAISTILGLEYVVLRCADLERSRAFYQALGFELVAEQHGSGARHYSCAVGGIVLELYPLSGRPTSGLRLGLGVSSVEAVTEAMKQLGVSPVPVLPGESSPSIVIQDPDGHEIVFTQRS